MVTNCSFCAIHPRLEEVEVFLHHLDKTQHLIDNYNKIHGPNPDVIIASLWERMTIDDIIQMEQQDQ